jgi:hypothetical protein
LCLSFFYSIDGLSVNNLQVEVKDLETGMNRSIWQSNDDMAGAWVKGEAVYTYGSIHKVCRSKIQIPVKALLFSHCICHLKRV